MIRIEFQDFDKIVKGFTRLEIPVQEVAKEVQALQIEQLSTPKSYDGSQLTPLTKKYRDWKIKKGYPSAIFQLTGKLLKSIRLKRINKESYEIYIDKDRADIMKYLQKGQRPMAGQRRGFGISGTNFNSICEKLFKKNILK